MSSSNKDTYVVMQRDAGGVLSDKTSAFDDWEKKQPDELTLNYSPRTETITVTVKTRGDGEYNDTLGTNVPEDAKGISLKLGEKLGKAEGTIVYSGDGWEVGHEVRFELDLKEKGAKQVVPAELKEVLASEGWNHPRIDAFIAALPSVERQAAVGREEEERSGKVAKLHDDMRQSGEVTFRAKHALEGLSGQTTSVVYSGIETRLGADTRANTLVSAVEIDTDMHLLRLQIPYRQTTEGNELAAALNAKAIPARVSANSRSTQHGNGLETTELVINYQGVPPSVLKEVFSKDGPGHSIMPAEVMEQLANTSHSKGDNIPEPRSGWAVK